MEMRKMKNRIADWLAEKYDDYPRALQKGKYPFIIIPHSMRLSYPKSQFHKIITKDRRAKGCGGSGPA